MKIEANTLSDNLLVFATEDDVISGGNFHAEPVAIVEDNLALAIAEIDSFIIGTSYFHDDGSSYVIAFTVFGDQWQANG